MNSYVAKLYGIYLALYKICRQQLSKKRNHHYIRATNNQNALQSLVLPKCHSRQFIILLIIEQIEKLKGLNTHILFLLIFAHEKILGKEHAHILALKTKKTYSPGLLTIGLKQLKSALI